MTCQQSNFLQGCMSEVIGLVHDSGCPHCSNFIDSNFDPLFDDLSLDLELSCSFLGDEEFLEASTSQLGLTWPNGEGRPSFYKWNG